MYCQSCGKPILEDDKFCNHCGKPVNSKLHQLLQFDWQKSPVHLLFLATFLQPGTLEDLSDAADWKLKLGEEPQITIERFRATGVVVRASLSEHLEHKFTVAELKEMLRQHNLPVSGNKNELVFRLIQADPENMRQAVSDQIVLKCSEKGQKIAEDFLACGLEPLVRDGKFSTQEIKRIVEWILLAAISGIIGDAAYDTVKSWAEKSKVESQEPAVIPSSSPVPTSTPVEPAPRDETSESQPVDAQSYYYRGSTQKLELKQDKRTEDLHQIPANENDRRRTQLAKQGLHVVNVPGYSTLEETLTKSVGFNYLKEGIVIENRSDRVASVTASIVEWPSGITVETVSCQIPAWRNHRLRFQHTEIPLGKGYRVEASSDTEWV